MHISVSRELRKTVKSTYHFLIMGLISQGKETFVGFLTLNFCQATKKWKKTNPGNFNFVLKRNN